MGSDGSEGLDIVRAGLNPLLFCLFHVERFEEAIAAIWLFHVEHLHSFGGALTLYICKCRETAHQELTKVGFLSSSLRPCPSRFGCSTWNAPMGWRFLGRLASRGDFSIFVMAWAVAPTFLFHVEHFSEPPFLFHVERLGEAIPLLHSITRLPHLLCC